MDSHSVEHAGFIERVTRVPAGIRDDLVRIQPLLKKNRDAIALDLESADLSRMKDIDREALKEAHKNLRRFADLHPGLDLHGIFSAEADPGKAAARAEERVGWLSTVFDLNPDINLLTLDYLPDSPDLTQVQFGPLSEDARQHVLQELKTHQRIQAVANSAPAPAELALSSFCLETPRRGGRRLARG